MANLNQLRDAIEPYLSDKNGIASIPEGFLSLLEEADDDTRLAAERVEGTLALYAGNKISQEDLKTGIRTALGEQMLIVGQPVFLGQTDYTSLYSAWHNGVASTLLRRGVGLAVSLGKPRELREKVYAS